MSTGECCTHWLFVAALNVKKMFAEIIPPLTKLEMKVICHVLFLLHVFMLSVKF